MIIELDINGARVIVSGENLSISVTEGERERVIQPAKPRAIREGDSPLTTWRKRAGLRQHELAAMLGVNTSFVSQVENGVSSPSLELAVKISEICGDAVPMASLARKVA